MKLSATIITLNEEKNIVDCLKSLDFVDEIIVLDSGSSDRTEQICRVNGKVRFFYQEWLGYGVQKNRAAELASNDWILNIDADERVSPELKASVVKVDRASFSEFRMARENYFGERWIRHCGWYPDYTTRLYDRTVCRFSERSVHETLEHDGRAGTLSGNLRHFTYTGINDYLSRMNRYSSLAADEIVKTGKKPCVAVLIYKPLFTFLKMYLVKRGVLDGMHGFLLSVLYSFYTFSKYAKARELMHDK